MSKGNGRWYYITPRFSRPIGSRTGVSITYTYSRFTNPDDAIIFGYGTEFLSPWAAVYEGSSVMLNVKSYLIPHLVVSAGSGYWEKTYLKSLQKHPIFGYGLPKDAPRRHDYYTRLYVSIERPIPIEINGMLVPSVTID